VSQLLALKTLKNVKRKKWDAVTGGGEKLDGGLERNEKEIMRSLAALL